MNCLQCNVVGSSPYSHIQRKRQRFIKNEHLRYARQKYCFHKNYGIVHSKGASYLNNLFNSIAASNNGTNIVLRAKCAH